jgi:pimeloyl-ACP methyl ester carboxylesterase
MKHIKAPTLVIWGREDKTNALEMGETTAAEIPGSKFIVYDETGHGVPNEQPERFNKDVLEFLTS